MTQFWINSPFRETSKIENFISKLIHENGIRYIYPVKPNVIFAVNIDIQWATK